MTKIENNPDALLAMRKQVELQRKLIRAVTSDGLSYFRPHDKQDQFFQAGGVKRRMMRAGNRTGKSTVGCAEDCAWLKGERSWYKQSFDVCKRDTTSGASVLSRRHSGSPNHPLVRQGIPQHKVKGLVVTTDWKKVDEIFTGPDGKLWKFLPKDFIKRTKKNHNGVTHIIECANGSTLTFDTVQAFKNNEQTSESSDWDFIHVDEPIPQDMWKAVARGLVDRGGSAWFTLTPLREAWINDTFFPRELDGDAASVAGNHWSVQAEIYDNPFLTLENIQMYANDLTEDEKECRLRGLPLYLSGLIYKQFSYSRHVFTTPPKDWTNLSSPPNSWPVYVYIDFHPQTPHHILGLSVSPHGHLFYWLDVFKHCGVPELASTVLDRVGSRRLVRCCIDPSAFIEHPILEGTTFGDELIAAGLYVEKAHKDLSGGIILTQDALELGKKDPKLQKVFVSCQCQRFLWEIQRYCWDEKENKPVDKDDHAMENFYRSIYDQPVWVEPSTDSTEQVADEIIRGHDADDMTIGSLAEV